MHGIAGAVDFQRDDGGRAWEGTAEEIDQRGGHPSHLDARRCVLQAAHGRLGTARAAAFRRPA